MFDAFMQFGDVKGDSTDKDHKDWIVITGFQHSVAQREPAVSNTSGTQAGEAVTFSEFEVHKVYDISTPKLYEAACNGTHIPKVVLELVKSNGGPIKYVQIELKNVLITGIIHTSDPNNASLAPKESMKMKFETIGWTFRDNTNVVTANLTAR